MSIQSKLQNIQMSVTKRNCLKKSCWFVSRLAYFYYGNVINFQQTCQIQSKLQNIQISGTKRKYERSEQIFKTVTFSWVVYLSHQPFLPLCFRWNCFGWSKWIRCSDGNRTVPSREVPGRSRDGTGQDLETLKVPWSCRPGTKEVQKSRDLKWEKSRGKCQH